MQSALCCFVHDPKRWYNGMLGLPEHARGPIQIFHQKFTEVCLTSKLCYWSTSKLCIYTDYMVAFKNSAWMYYIEKINNSEYLLNKKRLSVKYGFSVPSNPWVLSIVGIMCASTLGICGQYIVNREDVSHHCFMYLYFVSHFFIAYLIIFIASVS
jgi:hypothetical protein